MTMIVVAEIVLCKERNEQLIVHGRVTADSSSGARIKLGALVRELAKVKAMIE